MTTTFAAPGPGQWDLDRSHYPNGTTPISQWLLVEGMLGFVTVFEELGVPARGVNMEFVNGFMYTRLTPLLGANSTPRKPPPTAVLKLVTRLHPEFRARNKSAISTLRDRPWNKIIARWNNELRPRLEATNR